MKRYKVRFTSEAQDDLLRLYDFLLEKDISAAENALEAIKGAIELLRFSPFSCRKALPDNSFLRELIIPFGAGGYVALFEIEPGNKVSILAVRHQREEDFQ
ncbi:MAG: type II toxin-antitoxin system RelE/ParE family toxin [Pseudomonadota bacterium]